LWVEGSKGLGIRDLKMVKFISRIFNMGVEGKYVSARRRSKERDNSNSFKAYCTR